MDSIHGQIDGVFPELIQLQSVDLHHQIERGALGLLSESHTHLGIHIRHDHLAILIRKGDAKLVVALFDPVKTHACDHRAMVDGVGDLSGGDRVKGPEDADLATVIDRRVAEGEDFEFQCSQYGGLRGRVKLPPMKIPELEPGGGPHGGEVNAPCKRAAGVSWFEGTSDS